MRTSFKGSRISKNGIIECLSYLKKHAMKNYVKEEVADPNGDEIEAKQKKDLVKIKMSISVSIGTHMYFHLRSSFLS